MELRHLRSFVAVAKELHLAAAQRLHVAQPAVSEQIHKLEDEALTKAIVPGRHTEHLPTVAFLPAAARTLVHAAVCAGEALTCLRLGAAIRRAHSVPQAVHPAREITASGDHQPDADAAAGLALLAYELLDAHADTGRLADGLASDGSWAAHLDYLRALQRKGRETLARTASGEPSPFRCAGLG